MPKNYPKFLFVALSLLGGCQSRRFSSPENKVRTVPTSCSSEIDISKYFQNDMQCYSKSLEKKRHLYPWIPCNKSQVFAHSEDPRENNASTQLWLKNSKPFSSQIVEQMLLAPEQPIEQASGFPVINSPIHQAMVQIFREAKESIFFDIFLLGGYWGTEISRELVLASKRGVQVLLVRDTENPFAFRNEIDPLMNGLVNYAKTSENFVAMRAQIHKRPSFLPLGIDNVLKPFFANTNLNNTPLLQSDHSKIIIVDGFSRQPKMLVGSKNMTDFGAAVNFDEVVRIDGPAAAVSLLAYTQDIALAYELAKKENQLSPKNEQFVQSWLAEATARLKGNKSTFVAGAGEAEVRIAENNGDDSVRNVEHSVINLIESAKKSVKFYGMGMIPYSLEFTKAMARAQGRGVKVYPLLDSRLGLLTGNAFLSQMAQYTGGQSHQQAETKWRNLLPVESMPNGRPDLNQQQHTKTIIIDDEVVFLGSANQDAATFEGNFREFSVAIRNSPAVKSAVTNFDTVFNSKPHVVGAQEIVEKEKSKFSGILDVAKNKALTDYLRLRGARVKLVEADKTVGNCE